MTRSVSREPSPRTPSRAGVVLVNSGAFLLQLAGRLAMAAILLFLLSAVFARCKDAGDYPLCRRVITLENSIEKPVVALLRRAVPTKLNGTDISRWLWLLGLYALSVAAGRGAAELEFHAESLEYRRTRRDGDPLKAGLDRAQLLDIYARAKKTLEQQKRHLAFLSIDVVDSTGMKVGEDAGIAERDFRCYKQLVERSTAAQHVLKSTWTPDGVMFCLATVPDAVRAAQGVVAGLAEFNRSVKAIRRDFAVRIGINAGEVFFDEEVPMEEMSDRVIDIAGHMQKHGIVNGICIPQAAIEPFLKEFDFSPVPRTIDGLPVCEWRSPERPS